MSNLVERYQNAELALEEAVGSLQQAKIHLAGLKADGEPVSFELMMLENAKKNLESVQTSLIQLRRTIVICQVCGQDHDVTDLEGLPAGACPGGEG